MTNKSFEEKLLHIEFLYLDPNNFRLINDRSFTYVNEEDITDPNIQKRTMLLVSGKKNENIDDLLSSFTKVGYLPVDVIQVTEIDVNKYKVIEGNRRVTTLKYLYSLYCEGLSIGGLDPSIFSSVPVVVYPKEDLDKHKIVMGLKHISGTKSWPAWNQAKYLELLIKNQNMNERDVAETLGVSLAYLRKAMKTLALIDEYSESDFGDQFRPDMFTIFEEIIKSSDVKKWIEWDDTQYCAKNKTNLHRLFSWLSEEDEWNSDLQDHDEDSPFSEPRKTKIINNYQDIRNLRQIINSNDAINIMETTGSIEGAKKILETEKVLKSINVSPQLNQKTVENPDMQKEIIFKEKPSHFSKIHIEKYKLFGNLKVDNLNKINIITGINNVGKSSFLEAIYILSKLNDVYSFFDINRRRGKFLSEINSSWINNQLRSEYKISGFFNDKEVKSRIFLNEELDSSIDKSSYITTLYINAEYDEKVYLSSSRLYENTKHSMHYSQIFNLCYSNYTTPFSMQQQEEVVRFHQKNVETKNIDKIINFLKDNVDKNIENINLVGDLNRFLVTHKKHEEALDLTNFGEGMQRIFHLSLQFAAAENGVIFIDELENAIHYTLLKDFSRLIISLAEQFHVQVFVTSHSKECINAFLYNGTNRDNISAYRFERDIDESITPHYVSGNELFDLIEYFDMDLRGGS